MKLGFNHGTLVQLVKAFAPKTPPNGVCRGFIKMWIQALLTSPEAENQFYGRLSFLSQYFSKENNTIKNLKAKIDSIFSQRSTMTSENLDLIEIRGFCEAIAIQQAPSTLKLDSKFISMNDHPILTPLTASKALKDKTIHAIDLGLMTPNRLELSNYFRDLEKQIISQNTTLPPKMPFFLSSDKHTIGLYFNTQSNKWHFLDINPYLNADKKKYSTPPALDYETLANSIFDGSLDTNSEHTIFSMNYCCTDLHPELIKKLTTTTQAILSHPNRTNIRGVNKLLLAAKLGYTASVTELIASGFDMNAKDNEGMNALMWAARHGHLDIIKVLLTKGAIVDNVSNKGATALSLATKNGHTEIIEALTKANKLKSSIPRFSAMPQSAPSFQAMPQSEPSFQAMPVIPKSQPSFQSVPMPPPTQPKTNKKSDQGYKLGLLAGVILLSVALACSIALGAPLWLGIVLGVSLGGLAVSSLYIHFSQAKPAGLPAQNVQPKNKAEQLASKVENIAHSNPSPNPQKPLESQAEKPLKNKPRPKK